MFDLGLLQVGDHLGGGGIVFSVIPLSYEVPLGITRATRGRLVNGEAVEKQGAAQNKVLSGIAVNIEQFDNHRSALVQGIQADCERG